MSTKRINLPGVGVVALHKRKGTRTIRLSVSRTGEVRVSMPYWLPFDAGATFALSKASWIQAQLETQPIKLLAHGQAIGKSHHLYFRRDIGASKPTARVSNTIIRVVHPLNMEPTDNAAQKAATSACIRALRQQAEALLPQRLETLASTHEFTYRSVAIKQLRSRWGSCDTSHNIVLNLFLMQLPWYLIDYVLLHELTHTKALHHGSAFWQELERHLPQAKHLRSEIRQYSPMVTGKTNP